MDTHYNIHARACGCAYEKGNGKEWERKRITAAVKNIRTFFKRTGIFLENGLILFRKDKDVRAGEERTYHIRIRRIPCTPGRFTKHLQQSFAKLLPLLPPFLLKPPWTGRFKGWWQHFFLRGKKGCCHHFYPFLSRNDRWRGKKQEAEEDQTTGKGDGSDRQKPEITPAERSLMKDKTLTAT